MIFVQNRLFKKNSYPLYIELGADRIQPVQPALLSVAQIEKGDRELIFHSARDKIYDRLQGGMRFWPNVQHMINDLSPAPFFIEPQLFAKQLRRGDPGALRRNGFPRGLHIAEQVLFCIPAAQGVLYFILIEQYIRGGRWAASGKAPPPCTKPRLIAPVTELL